MVGSTDQFHHLVLVVLKMIICNVKGLKWLIQSSCEKTYKKLIQQSTRKHWIASSRIPDSSSMFLQKPIRFFDVRKVTKRVIKINKFLKKKSWQALTSPFTSASAVDLASSAFTLSSPALIHVTSETVLPKHAKVWNQPKRLNIWTGQQGKDLYNKTGCKKWWTINNGSCTTATIFPGVTDLRN